MRNDAHLSHDMPTRSGLKILALAAACGFTGCRALDLYEHLHRQLPTFADMLNISRQITEAAPGGVPAEADVQRIVKRYNEGADRWGTRFVFHARREPAPGYLLVSLGADRQLDVPSIDEYFQLERQDITDDPDRDIVFRDGEAITIAARK
jgi:hypothetical protein